MRIGLAWAGVGCLILVGCASDAVLGNSGRGTPQPAVAARGSHAIVAGAGQELGRSASSVGDLDGDGIDDFVIFALASDRNGVAYLYYGKRDFPVQLSTEAADASFRGQLGHVQGAGDLNGDGRADLLLNGADWTQFVFGSSQRLRGEIDAAKIGVRWKASQVPGTQLQVVPAGDVNGDGLDDLLVGVADLRLPSPLDIDPWRRLLVLGRKQGWLTGLVHDSWATATFAMQHIDVVNSPTTVMPTAIALGDVDGDGCADLGVVSSYTTMRLHYGGPDKLRGVLGDAEADAILGHTGGLYEAVGDVDGDGRDDLSTRLHSADQSSASPGISVIYGRSERWSGVVTPAVDLTLLPPMAAAASDWFLSALKVGDVDRDADPDLVAAIPQASEVYLIHGNGERLLGGYELRPEQLLMRGVQFERPEDGTPGVASDGLGTALDARGDLDGDGSADVLAGAPGSQEPNFVGGSVFLISGSDQRPL